MRRLSLILGPPAAATLAAAALAAPAAAVAPAPPRAALKSFTCTRAMDPINRSVGVTAVMRPLVGTRRLQIRFTLQVARVGGDVWRTVRAGDLGTWIDPANPTLGQLPRDVWNLQKTVLAVGAPAQYRFKVGFRWLGARRVVLGTATRTSADCLQRELRPDLRVRSIDVAPAAGMANEDLYTAHIANTGNSAAGPFDVLFDPGDGSSTTTTTVARLRAHRGRLISFYGPVCNAAAPPTVTVDSAHQVDDLNRANNVLQATCPS